MTRMLRQDVEYVDVRSLPDRHEPTDFYEKWLDQSSGKHVDPGLVAVDALRRLYPEYSIVVSDDRRLTSFLTLPDIIIRPSDPREARLEQVTNVVFAPMPTRIGGRAAGSLIDDTIIGSYKLTWNNSDFIVYITKFQNQGFIRTVYFVLHEGPEQPARDLVLAVCLHAEQAHNEVWVFNRGVWSKNKTLWLEVQDSSWDTIIMKEDSKKALQNDVYGFFESKTTYEKLSIPWKRGLIMYGPPGNGKTISIKVIMKTCIDRGFVALYVKSFSSPSGEEVAIQNVFLKARQLAPCVLILEDLDSLINDWNRSFFLNELDGLEGNEGILVIASTNHLDKLDPGLSNRPSRFDRKYLFDDPDYQERMLYAKYWQEKLRDNDAIPFPESLVREVADLTQGFSFAYLKEAFVSALVRINNADDDEPVAFQVMLKSQIMILRKELGERVSASTIPSSTQLEKELDKRALPAKQLSTTWREEAHSQRSLGPAQLELPLPVDVFLDDSSSCPLPVTQGVRGTLTSRRDLEKVFGTGSTTHPGTLSPQGRVLHAPHSAYPQVMPGSLPSASGVDVSRRNPFSPDISH